MRKHVVSAALGGLLALLLGGCQTLALLEQVQAERDGAAASSSPGAPARESPGLPTKPAGEPPASGTRQEPLTVRGGGERILSASFADILDWHSGSRALSFSASKGFYYLAGESDIQYYLTDPIEQSGAYDFYYPPDYLDMATDPYGSPHYDFQGGKYSPQDFAVTSFQIWGDALTALFEGEEAITPQRLNQIFDTVRYVHWSRGEEGMLLYLMGPYRAGGCCMDFFLDDRQEYITGATISSTGVTHAYEMYCGGLEPGGDGIWLTQVPPEGAADAGGDHRYPMTRELRAELQASPPVVGARYYAILNGDGQIVQLISSGSTVGQSIRPDVLDILSQAVDVQSLMDMRALDLTYESIPDFTDQYYWPARRLGLDSQTWASPEQLNPEALLDCYEFYDFAPDYLKEHHPEIDFYDMEMDGKEFWVPQEIVEDSIRKFVPVPTEQLRGSCRYSAEEQAYRMVLMFGRGDGAWSEVSRAWWADNILLLEILTDGDTDYLLLDRGGDNPVYLAAAHLPFDG